MSHQATAPSWGDSVFPRPKFEVIAADPPWEFKTYSAKGQNRGPEAHYPTMSVEEIASLPIREMASPRAVLFLWVTWPVIFKAQKVMEAWGFEYRAKAFTWVKSTKRSQDNLYARLLQVLKHQARAQDVIDFLGEGFWHMGNGYYSRANDEVCLLGIPKKMQNPVASRAVRSLIIAPVGEHSAKPEEFYRRVEALYPRKPDRRYLELFARQRRPGWVTVGNEVNDGMDIRAALARVREEDTGHNAHYEKPQSAPPTSRGAIL